MVWSELIAWHVCSAHGCACVSAGFDPLGLLDPVNAGGFITPEWLVYSEVCSQLFSTCACSSACLQRNIAFIT